MNCPQLLYQAGHCPVGDGHVCLQLLGMEDRLTSSSDTTPVPAPVIVFQVSELVYSTPPLCDLLDRQALCF